VVPGSWEGGIGGSEGDADADGLADALAEGFADDDADGACESEGCCAAGWHAVKKATAKASVRKIAISFRVFILISPFSLIICLISI